MKIDDMLVNLSMVRGLTLKQMINVAEDLLYLQGIDLPVKDEKIKYYGLGGVERIVAVRSSHDPKKTKGRVFQYQVTDRVGLYAIAEAKYTSLQIQELRQEDALKKNDRQRQDLS